MLFEMLEFINFISITSYNPTRYSQVYSPFCKEMQLTSLRKSRFFFLIFEIAKISIV